MDATEEAMLMEPKKKDPFEQFPKGYAFCRENPHESLTQLLIDLPSVDFLHSLTIFDKLPVVVCVVSGAL